MNNENILNLENATLFKDNKNTKKKKKINILFINNICIFLFIFNILFFRLKRMQFNFRKMS